MSVDSLVAEVAPLSDAIRGTLSYCVPEGMREQIAAGVAVVVPLRSRLVAGIVMAVRSYEHLTQAERRYDLKPIHTLLDAKPVLNEAQLELARWLSAEYCASLGRCCALMVPPGFTPSSAYLYALADERYLPSDDGPDAPPNVRAQVIAVLRRRGALVESKLKTALRGVKGWRNVLKALVQEGVVTRTSTVAPVVVKPLKTTLVQLAISEATLDIVLRNLDDEATKNPRRANALGRRGSVLGYLLQRNGLAWAEWVYAETGATRTDLDWLSQRDYILLGDAERWRDPLADIDYVVSSPPPLTDDQARAWETIRRAMDQKMDQRQFLLRGVTGSGKTEIYMRAVEMALQQGRGALVLVPEISLTPQTARRFLSRFPGKVALIHSRLKPGERYDTWRRIRAGELAVVVGARSALFAPLPKVGVIILDEEHDQSYKQSSPPYYDTRRAAMHYAASCDATLIMGSATPSLEAWHMSQPASITLQGRRVGTDGRLVMIELPNRVRGHVNRIADQQARLGIHTSVQRETDAVAYQPLPDVQVIDMRAELRGGNTSMFSGALTLALGETLQRGEQAILFLNRRGTASCVICRDCGHVLRCPNDDVPLTYHQAPAEETGSLETNRPVRANPKSRAGSGAGRTRRMVVSANTSVVKCHQCNHVELAPSKCPSCGSVRIRYIGIGTQKVEQSLREQFPGARVVRWDKDASMASGHSSADQLLQRFVNRQADVLVGTQMIAKGLDLPLVTLVGVVLADVGMFLPDFRASERVFNLIEQVAGRAGRGLLSGRVIVQTYNPEHPAISFAARHDVLGFAQYELAQRMMLNLPPYTRLVRFEISHEDNAIAQHACEMLARQLRRRVSLESDLIGPAQAYFVRHSRRYRWHLFARTQSPQHLLSGIELPRGCVVDVDPLNVL
ncbi:MAG: primosomal protein N' [Chloroflexi bacterium]|nr:primosomal protein N' [Chloroflexota bacterium]